MRNKKYKLPIFTNNFVYTFFITIIFIVFLLPKTTLAHPLDITATELHVTSKDSDIKAFTYIHPFLVGMLLNDNGIAYDTTADYYKHKKFIAEYLNNKIKFENNDNPCSITLVNFPPLDEFEIVGGGMEIDYNISCSGIIGRLDFFNELFIEYSDLQTNKMLLFKNDEMQTEKIMTVKITGSFFDFSNTENNNIKIIDTDLDGLGDDEEELYGTDLNNQDSDFDGYTDKEEVDNGWYATDWQTSPGQKELVSPEKAKKLYNDYYQEFFINNTETLEKIEKDKKQESEKLSTDVLIDNTINQTLTENSFENQLTNNINLEKSSSTSSAKIIVTSEESNHANNSSDYFNTGHLQKYLSQIKTLFEQGGVKPFLFILILIYLLGVLHAFESGHGKSILLSYLVEYDKNAKDVFIFSLMMTATHLADVIILSLVFKFLSLKVDIYNYINDIQHIGAYLLLLIGIFYLIRTFFSKKQERWRSYEKAAWLGIIAGLAPCTIGWAIMVIMLSIGKMNLLVPVIIFFGLGIWSTLLIFGFFVIKIKDKFIAKLPNFSRITSIFSALMLIIIAIIFLLK